MKNKYKSWGNHTLIFSRYKGKFEGIWIDTRLLQKVNAYSGTWCINKNKNTKYSYIHTKVNNNPTTVYMHRAILTPPSDCMIDHKNRNGLDNRLINLNVVKNSENQMNKDIQSNNTSGVKGVSWNRKAKKWEVRLQINSKSLYLGLYSDLDEAKQVRAEAEQKYFSYLSSIDEVCLN